ncbi:hypothetical protein KEJ45_01495 [Candidatus Bathyarchaeota archaeon]|nr:hypothetical protein [Candidatus Bathyarchaeota archaeon]
MKKADVIGLFFILLGVSLIIHHIIFWQRPFDIGDMLHHEFFEAIFLTAGITLFIATRLNNTKKG